MYERPGHRHYATASGTHFHGAPVVYDGIPGVAFKQGVVSSGAGSGDVQKTIANGEAFTIICKGRVELTNTSTWVRGGKLFISSTHVISTTGTTGTKFGVIVEVAGERGCPTGKMRVDLDLKSLI